MGLFQNEIRIVGKPKNNNTFIVQTKSLNGYDAIRRKLDEDNTLTVKQPVVVNEKSKTKNQYCIKLILVFIITHIGEIMALYQASDFTGFSDSYAVPAGSSDVIFTGSVDLI